MKNHIEITNFNDPNLDLYARLSEVQLLRYAEPKQGIFVAESPKGNRTGLCKRGMNRYLSCWRIRIWTGKRWRFWNSGRIFQSIRQRMRCYGN